MRRVRPCDHLGVCQDLHPRCEGCGASLDQQHENLPWDWIGDALLVGVALCLGLAVVVGGVVVMSAR